MKKFIPSKTFIAGEYSVLVGGASLTVATNPCFEVSTLDFDNGFRFHPDSPAGLHQSNSIDQNFIHFFDPYVSRGIKGGFGKSTAEYLAVRLKELALKKPAVQELRAEYLKLFDKEKVKPSGVDLVTQYLGDWVFSNLNQNNFKNAKYRFNELNWVLISTGLKIQTHEHLKSLNLKNLEILPAISNQVIDCFINKSDEDFIFSIKEWSQALAKLKLTHDHVLDFLKYLKQNISEILTVKPCGALGADVVVVFYKSIDKESVINKLRALKINIQATQNDVSKGFLSELG